MIKFLKLLDSGKSTLLKAISGRLNYGLLTGKVIINGKSLSNKELRTVIGYTSQNNQLIYKLSVFEILYITARLHVPAMIYLLTDRHNIVKSKYYNRINIREN